MTASLSDEEAALLDFYRVMRPSDREAVLHIARGMAERVEAIDAARPKGFKRGDEA